MRHNKSEWIFFHISLTFYLPNLSIFKPKHIIPLTFFMTHHWFPNKAYILKTIS